MKKLFSIMMALLFGAGLYAQQPDENDLTQLHTLYQSFKQLIPYDDKEQNLSIVDAALNTDRHYLQLTIRVENNRVLETDSNVYLRYLVSNPNWDLLPLADHCYSLYVDVQSSKKRENQIAPTKVVYSYRPSTIRNLLYPHMAIEARNYLREYAEKMQRSLPIPTNGDVVLTECRFNDDSSMFFMTEEYPAAEWQKVKPYLIREYDKNLSNLAYWLATDTTNGLGAAFYVGVVKLRYRYRGQQHGECVDFNISPEMFAQVFRLLESQKKSHKTTPMGRLREYVEQYNQDLKNELDTAKFSTRSGVKGFQLDSARLQLTLLTEISDTKMEQLLTEDNEAICLVLANGLIRSPEGKELARMLVEANVEMVYAYVSPYYDEPYNAVIEPERLKRMLE